MFVNVSAVLIVLANMLLLGVTGMHGPGCCVTVRFHDIHLCTTDTTRALWAHLQPLTVRILSRMLRPALHVCTMPRDELHVRTLRITVACAEFGTGRIQVAIVASILGHFDKVQGCIRTTWDSREVNIKCEFAILQFEDLVGSVRVHEVEAGTPGEAERNAVVHRRNAIGTGVCLHVCTINLTRLCARGRVRADSWIPARAILLHAILEAPFAVQPTPIAVHGYHRSLRRASSTGTPADAHWHMHLVLASTRLLRLCTPGSTQHEPQAQNTTCRTCSAHGTSV